MGKGTKSTKMRQKEAQNKKKARIARALAAAKGGKRR